VLSKRAIYYADKTVGRPIWGNPGRLAAGCVAAESRHMDNIVAASARLFGIAAPVSFQPSLRTAALAGVAPKLTVAPV